MAFALPIALVTAVIALANTLWVPAGPHIENPRQYLVQRLQEEPLPGVWWAAYRETDPEVLAQLVDRIDDSLANGLPHDQDLLDDLVRYQLLELFKNTTVDTPEGQRGITRRAQSRFADPPVSRLADNPETVLVDINVLPAPWRYVNNVHMAMVDPEAVDGLLLLDREISRVLRLAVDQEPNAGTYLIRYSFFSGSSFHTVVLRFAPDQPTCLYAEALSECTLGLTEWDATLSGTARLSTAQWLSPATIEIPDLPNL